MVYGRLGAGGSTALKRPIRALRDRYSPMDYPDVTLFPHVVGATCRAPARVWPTILSEYRLRRGISEDARNDEFAQMNQSGVRWCGEFRSDDFCRDGAFETAPGRAEIPVKFQ